MKKLLLTLAALTIMATGASAQTVLWDQSDFDMVEQWGMWDAVSGCAPFGGSVHYASDFWTGDEVRITRITSYFTGFNFETASTAEAYLLIVPKTGSLPVDGVDLPQENGTLVPVTMTNVDGFYHMVADGLDIYLTQGEYWVSLTPIMPGGPWGPDFHLRSMTPWGDPSASYEYCGMFAPTWTPNIDSLDAAMLIEGVIEVVPNEDRTWSDMKTMFR